MMSWTPITFNPIHIQLINRIELIITDHQPAAAETVCGAAQKRGSDQADKCFPGG